ncbi:MAG: hypothetical protein EU530_09055 [Promethearchaeota archaeon]|nr:MAG: hypothetical protein EU530_09055 [Candidatus Lokiarchaeota archaeon]
METLQFSTISDEIDEPSLFFNHSLDYNFNSLRMNYTLFVYEENHTNGDFTYNISIDGYCEITHETAINETVNQTRYSIIWINGANIGYYYTFINTTEMELEQKRFFHINLTYTCNSQLDLLGWGHDAPFGAGIDYYEWFREITYHTYEKQILVPNIHDFHYTHTIMTDNTTIFTDHHVFWPNISRNVAYGEWTSSKTINALMNDAIWDNTTLDFTISFVNWEENDGLSVGTGHSSTQEFNRPINETEIHQNWVMLTGLDYDPFNLSYSSFGFNYSNRMELVFDWEFGFPNNRIYRLDYTFVQNIMEEPCPECPEPPPSKWNWGEYISIGLGSSIVIALGSVVTLNVLKRRKK